MPYSNKTAGDLIENRFNRSIASDGIDMINETVNGESFTRDTPRSAALRSFVQSKARQTLAFFFGPFMGFRNDSINKKTGEREGLGWTLAKNLLWWPEADMARGLRVAQFVAMALLTVTGIRPLYVALQVVLTPVMNLVRSVLEVLPGFAFDGFSELQNRARARLADTDPATKPGKTTEFFLNVADMALDIPRALFGLVHFVGRAIVSPIDGARQARKDFGLFGAVVSGVLSAAAYTVGFPFAVAYGSSLVATYVTPFVTSYITTPATAFLNAYAPAVMTSIVTPAVNWVGGLAMQATLMMSSATAAKFIGMLVNPVLGLVPESISIALGLTAMNVAIAAAATVAITTVGLVASKAYNAARFAITKPLEVRVLDAVAAAVVKLPHAQLNQINVGPSLADSLAAPRNLRVVADADKNHRDNVVLHAAPADIDGAEKVDYSIPALRSSQAVINESVRRQVVDAQRQAQADAEAKHQAAQAIQAAQVEEAIRKSNVVEQPQFNPAPVAPVVAQDAPAPQPVEAPVAEAAAQTVALAANATAAQPAKIPTPPPAPKFVATPANIGGYGMHGFLAPAADSASSSSSASDVAENDNAPLKRSASFH